MEAFLDNLANESTFFKLADEDFFKLLLLPFLFKDEDDDNLVNPFCQLFKSDNESDETLCFLDCGVKSSIPSLFKYD